MDRHDDERESVDMPDTVDLATPSVSIREKPKQSGLTTALRRARLENAERTDVVTDLRSAEMTRLEILREHLQPVFDEVPGDCDFFDPGLAPGDKPRLFIDMVAFVEMARDRRSYRFLQDSRVGRTTLSESERLETTVRAVTDYIARRLIEREKAMVAFAAPSAATPVSVTTAASPAQPAVPPRRRSSGARIVARGFLFLIEIVGSAVVFGALATAAIWAWQTYIAR